MRRTSGHRRGCSEGQVVDMVVVGLALIGAVVVTAILAIVRLALTEAQGHRLAASELGRWAAAIFAGNLVLDLLILYFATPALTGPYNGWQWLLWPLLLTGVVVLAGSGWSGGHSLMDVLAQNTGGQWRPRAARPRGRVVDAGGRVTSGLGRGQAGLFAIGLVLVTGIVVNGLVAVSTTWFDGNAKALARIGHVQRESNTTPLPPTDVNHIVLVTQGVAAYLGQTVLGSGQNLGSTYHTEQTGYTLQSVKHHLYWIAPLVYNNVFANLSHMETPGYVVVDAEDPNVPATLRLGMHLHYLPGAILNQDLLRHVYLSGYTYGNLADPTLEVDDQWNPYFTISVLRPSRGFTGERLNSVLLVDPQSGAITSYPPDRVPSWVDRVMPADLVTQYLTWWGKYDSAPWFNPSGSGQQTPSTDTPELVYNNVDSPVWLEPMTSSAVTDNSSTGVVLYSTHSTAGSFYPLGGLGATSNVESAFQGNPHNLQHYTVGALQLYQIYGEPTWVAIFVQQNSYGENYEAIGILDARRLTGSNVIMESNKAQALAEYAQSLGSAGVQATGPSSSGQLVQVKGKVARISAATQGGSTVYYILLQGTNRIFTADLSRSAELPLVREGDTIQGTYIDTGQAVVTLTTFTDLDIQLATPAPTATSP
jgi:hypothetical protein